MTKNNKNNYFSIAIRYANFIILLLGAAVFFIPFVITVSTSLKVPEQVFSEKFIWIPNPVKFENYIRAWTQLPFNRFLLNTVVITITGLIGEIVSVAFTAYGFARFRFPGRGFLFMLVMATMMLPGIVTLIPTFLLFKYLNWIGTYFPLIVPSFFATNAFGIFLMRQFFLSIPLELDESAKLDGCNSLLIFIKILLPLTKPVIATIAILGFIGRWNDFMGPLMYLNSMNEYTLALGLRFMQTMWGVTPDQIANLMALSLIVMMPCIILFFAAQKYFVKGITLTGVNR